MAGGRRANPLVGRVKALVARVQGWKPVRVFVAYGAARGPILASGLAYQALFAVFAGLWAAFSVVGLVVSGDTALQETVLDALGDTVPGLIDDGTGSGAIDPSVLLSATVYNVTGAIAIVGLLVTALGWLGSARDSVREMFDLPGARTNFALRKLVDAGLGLTLGVLLLLAGALSFAATSATAWVLDLVGIAPDSVVATIVGRVVTLVVMSVLYAVALAGLYRLLAGIHLSWHLLRGGVLIGALGIAVLTIAGTALLGGATNNPLIASFAVVAGLLIYFNFVCQVILLGAAWMAVGVRDADVVLDEVVASERLAAARRLVADNEPEPEPDRRPWWRRLFRRRRT
jgi:membrane protein